MLRRSFTKLGLGLALVSGCAFLQPVKASALELNAHTETVDHRDRDRGRHDRDDWRWRARDRDDRSWRGYDHYYPGYESGFGFYFGSTPSYYYPAPYSAPAAAYPATPVNACGRRPTTRRLTDFRDTPPTP